MLEKQPEFETIFKNTPSTKSVLGIVKELDLEKLFSEVENELEKQFTLEGTNTGVISVRNDKRKNIQTTISSIEEVLEGVLRNNLSENEDVLEVMNMLFHVESMCSGRSIYISVRRA